MNTFTNNSREFKDLIKIKSDKSFHDYLIYDAIERYKFLMHANDNLGAILAIGAGYSEVTTFINYNFSDITISGFSEPSVELSEYLNADNRIKCIKNNIENLNINSQSYDIVFCKEALHHVARPVLGFYEMLRVCRKAAIIIEPYDTFVGTLLEGLKLSSVYEKNQRGNINERNNYVFRWNKRLLKKLLNSYYLESGYKVDLTLGWLSGKVLIEKPYYKRLLSILAGEIISLIPYSRGNYMTAIIIPGKDIPADPNPFA